MSAQLATTRSNGNSKFVIDGDGWRVESPTIEDITTKLDGLVANSNYFATLIVPNAAASTEMVDDCVYVQVAILGADDPDSVEGKYAVEAQFWHGLTNGKNVGDPGVEHKQYRMYTSSLADVKEVFTAFASGKAPNVAAWQDVTDRK